MTAIETDQERLMRVFHPFFTRKFSEARSRGTRFVHYTSAEAAVRILADKNIWMRKSSCMNDFTEIQHGLNCLSKAYRASTTFKSTINHLFDGLASEVERQFDALAPTISRDTYLLCLSEHKDEEDELGRLSMWRAYGRTTGVAIVFNNSVFFNPSKLGAYSRPVGYFSDQEFEKHLDKIAQNVRDEADFIKTQPRDTIQHFLFNLLRIASVCIKHPGFREEDEWRVIYSPALRASSFIEKGVSIINGVPQPICKIPLKTIPEASYDGEISSILSRIIIGPTQYPNAILEAFLELLVEAGVKDADRRVSLSRIPLRY